MTRILVKITVLALSVGSLQVLVLHRWFPRTTLSTGPTQERLRRESPTALYLGDSVFTATSTTDRGRQPMEELITSAGPGRQVVAQPSFTLPLFAAYLRWLDRVAHRPEVVILPFNLRSLSPVWNEYPHATFAREIFELDWSPNPLLEPFLHFLLAFRAVESPPTMDNFRNRPRYIGKERVGTFQELLRHSETQPWTDDVVRRQFRLAYSMSYTADHPILRALREIAGRDRRLGTRTILFFTPTDFETARALGGERFVTTLRERRSRIAGIWKDAGGGEPADLSEMLRADQFMWREENQVSEHLREGGRKALAERLVALAPLPVRQLSASPR